MAYIDLQILEKFANQARIQREYCKDNETQTRSSLINPYLDLIGIDVSDSKVVRQEHSIRLGTTTLKLDYAVIYRGKPLLIIEAKASGVKLDKSEREQLSSYVRSSNSVQIGVLTNGIEWIWYRRKSDRKGGTNIEKILEHNVTKPKETEVRWLQTFTLSKDKWKVAAIGEKLAIDFENLFSEPKKIDEDLLYAILIAIGVKNDDARDKEYQKALELLWNSKFPIIDKANDELRKQ